MIDIEVFRISDGTNTSWEFRATSSLGQEWLEDELGLKGTGSNTTKLVCNDAADALSTRIRMRDAGLNITAGNIGGLP